MPVFLNTFLTFVSQSGYKHSGADWQAEKPQHRNLLQRGKKMCANSPSGRLKTIRHRTGKSSGRF